MDVAPIFGVILPIGPVRYLPNLRTTPVPAAASLCASVAPLPLSVGGLLPSYPQLPLPQVRLLAAPPIVNHRLLLPGQ